MSARTTVPGRHAGGTSGLGLADRRGLTAAGGALLLLVATVLGTLLDDDLGLLFALAFSGGAVLAVLLVHREDVGAAVVAPPLVYAAVLGTLGALTGTSDGTGPLQRAALDVFTALVVGAPVLLGTTAVVLVLALARGLGRR